MSASLDGPLYDPVLDWRTAGGTTAAEQRPAPDAPFTIPEPAVRLRPFNSDELERIHSVQRAVHSAARTHGLPPDLVNGIIWVESRFKVRARSKSWALGLMQLMPRTGREIARELGTGYAPYDPAFNIHAGAYYFARMLERFGGNLRLSLAAYNIGPAVVQRWVRDQEPLPERSERYIENVFIAAHAFRQRGF